MYCYFVTCCAEDRGRIFTTHQVVGHDRSPWQEGVYDHVLREEEERIHYAEYIMMNPVRAGLVEDPRMYPFTYLCPEYEEFFFGGPRSRN